LSDGELKKQMLNLFDKHSPEGYLVGFKHATPHELSLLIDSAKKDLFSEIGWIEQGIKEEGELNGMDYYNFYQKIKPKLKKWFG
jgi:hypothetical protein